MSKSMRYLATVVLAAVLVLVGFMAVKNTVQAEELGMGEVVADLDDFKPEEPDASATDTAEKDESIHYDGPKEVFFNFIDSVKGAFNGFIGLYKTIGEKAGNGAMIGAIIGSIVWFLFFLFTLSICFKKAGIPQWLAFVPFVSVYYCFKLGWEGKRTWHLLLAIAGIIVFGMLAGIKELPITEKGWDVPGIFGTIFTLVRLLGFIILVVYVIRLAQGWAEAFAIHYTFGIGLLILPFLFVPILAFLKKDYRYALDTGKVKVSM